MARKISRQAAKAFMAIKPFSSGNTQVSVNGKKDIATMMLHGNVIAINAKWNTISAKGSNKRYIWITTADWNTRTTKDRLNAILEYTGDNDHVYTRDGQLYLSLGGTLILWDGSPIDKVIERSDS